MERKTKNQIVKCGVLCVLIMMVALTMLELYTHRPINETVVLQKQYLGDISDGCAGGCNGCLIMEVSKDGHDMTYYFAGEHEKRYDLLEEYLIDVRWEYKYSIGGYRIVSVDQHYYPI